MCESGSEARAGIVLIFEKKQVCFGHYGRLVNLFFSEEELGQTKQHVGKKRSRAFIFAASGLPTRLDG